MDKMDKLVVVVGQGYAGLPLAVRAAEVGFRVVGLDVDEFRVKRLASGESFAPDVTNERLASALDSGRYIATTEPKRCAGFDYAIVSVPTPLKDGAPDLSYIEAACAQLARFVRPGSTVVLESSTYPGTTEDIVRPVLEDGSGLTAGEDFFLGYSPERIDPGNTTWTLVNTPKIVSGIDAASTARIDRFYRRLVKRTVPVSRPAEAELAKLLENTFRHVNVALVNEMAMFAHELGIDIWDALDAAATKPFGYMRFNPGPGVGGHCLPVDPSYLSWRVRYALGRPSRFIELANDINTSMPTYVVNRLVLALNQRSLSIKDRNILLLGLSYKRNTGDARESPARAIASRLVALGAQVRAADPCLIEADVPAGVDLVDLTDAELAKADAVVLLVDHDQFNPASISNNGRLVLDCRRVLSGPNVEII
jgi:UDP-N-acetyl-D-glucosamine dehydrogenase